MLQSKRYDVVYPGAVAGIEKIEIVSEIKSFAEMAGGIEGSAEPVRIVRPTSITYDYRTVARD